MFHSVATIIGCLQVVTAIVYIWDKARAKLNTRRTPEKKLLIWTFFGPLGAAAGIWIVRHKCSKWRFLAPAILLMVVGAVLQLWALYALWPKTAEV